MVATRNVPAWVPTVFAALLGVVCTGAATYIALGSEVMTRAEHREDMRERGVPWSQDKPVVEHRLEVLTRSQEQLTDSVQRLGVDTAKVIQRLDDFLKAQDR